MHHTERTATAPATQCCKANIAFHWKLIQFWCTKMHSCCQSTRGHCSISQTSVKGEDIQFDNCLHMISETLALFLCLHTKPPNTPNMQSVTHLLQNQTLNSKLFELFSKLCFCIKTLHTNHQMISSYTLHLHTDETNVKHHKLVSFACSVCSGVHGSLSLHSHVHVHAQIYTVCMHIQYIQFKSEVNIHLSQIPDI